MTDATEQVVLIAGASRGIGAAAARAYAAAGAHLVLASRSWQRCEALAGELRGQGAQALAVACDVADFDQVQDAVAAALGRFGRLDVVVNNAGVIEPIAPLLDGDPAAWAQSVRINLIGAYHVLRAALPPMVAAGQGVAINVSSGAAHQALEGWSAYCSGKAGLARLTEAAALETADSGVRVIGFRPGVVDTDMQGAIRASGINPVSKLRREDLAPPEEPAAMLVWLASPAAADLAGQEVDVRDPGLRRRAGLPAA